MWWGGLSSLRCWSKGVQNLFARHPNLPLSSRAPCDFGKICQGFDMIWLKKWIYNHSDFEKKPSIIVNGLGLRKKWEEIMVVTHRYPLNGPFNQFLDCGLLRCLFWCSHEFKFFLEKQSTTSSKEMLAEHCRHNPLVTLKGFQCTNMYQSCPQREPIQKTKMVDLVQP